MVKRAFFLLALFLLASTAAANATLLTIGTATYDGSDYNLIWEDSNNGNSLIWLDYTNPANTWSAQNQWAADLDTALTINLDAGYSISWDDTAWRLPATVDGLWIDGYAGPDQNGNYNYTHGYNLYNSELGYLYYTELGNLGYYATDGTFPQSGYGLLNTGPFENLTASLNASWYWSGTEYAAGPVGAWGFDMYQGYQFTDVKNGSRYGLALRSGQVTVTAAPVPEPTTMLLSAMGLMAIAFVLRRRKRGRA